MAKASTKANALAKAKALMAKYPFIDGHNDLPWVIRQRTGAKGDDAGYDLRRIHNDGDTDIPRLRQGQVAAQVFAAFIPSEAEHPARMTLEQLDIANRIIATYPKDFHPLLRPGDVARARREGRIGVLVSVEGGVGLENSLAPLRTWHAMGARLMTLCHNGTLDWCDSATDAARHEGLTPFGRAVVRELNRLGMIADGAHVAPATMHAVLDTSTAPVVFSHSNARALCDHPRNVPDGVLDRVPANGGIVMATFVPDFLSEEVRQWMLPVRAAVTDAPGEDRMSLIRRREAEAGPRPRATLAHVADHIEYIANRIGPERVGVGSDFFGVPTTPQGLENVSRFPHLIAELVRRGWSDRHLAGLMGGNFLRVWRAVEAEGERLRKTTAPLVGTIRDFDGEGAPY
jgi:membrane dipeptidase